MPISLTRKTTRIAVATLVATTAGVGATFLSSGGRYTASTKGNNSGNNCAGQAQCTQTIVPSSAPATHKPRSIYADAPCGPPDPTVPAKRRAQICVLYWCRGDVFTVRGELVRSQFQLKIRALVSNYSDSAIDISTDKPSRIRLLVAGGGIDRRWNPRKKTLAYGDRPLLVPYQGRQYWAIAPNRPGTEVEGDQYWTGFLTTWGGPRSLGSHENYGVFSRKPHNGNLVFQVPLDGTNEEPLANVLGIALLEYDHKTPRVLTIDFASDWPDSQAPTSF